MSDSSLPDRTAAPCVLVVEDDPEIGETVRVLLSEEGYLIELVTTLEAALARVDERLFDFILTDLLTDIFDFTGTSADPLEAVERLLRRVQPTPVGIMTAWNIPPEQVAQRGFACLITKPFDVSELLMTVAQSIRVTRTAEQEIQVRVLRAYCEAFNAQNFDACLALCGDDLVFFPPNQTPFAEKEAISGKAAYRAHLEQGLLLVPGFRFEACYFYALAEGTAMRFEESWSIGDGRARMLATMIFGFTGERISRIGVNLDAERLSALMAAIPQ